MAKKNENEKELKKEKATKKEKAVKEVTEEEIETNQITEEETNTKQIRTRDLLGINTASVKEELTSYLRVVIDKEVSKVVEKSSKKLVRHKNAIIIRRDIIIVILLLVCLFLGYELVDRSNINIDINTKRKEASNSQVIEEEKSEESPVSEKEDLKEKYKHLTDDIYINEESPYVKDFYEGTLSDELKLYLAMNILDKDKVTSEDGTLYVDEGDLKEIYNLLFTDEYSGKSFKYGELSFKYLSKGLFWADGKYEKESSNIVKDIIEVKEEDESLEITTVEGLVKENKLYNILSDKEVKNYKGDSLEKYEDHLTKMVYDFEKIDDSYKLSKINLI